MALRALILAALLAIACSGTVGNKELSTAILDKLIDGLRAEGKLQGRQEEAITALREEFPDLITSVRNENKNSSDHALYTKIADFLKQQGELTPTSEIIAGGFSTSGSAPGSGGGGGSVPPSGGGGGHIPPSGGGGGYVPPSGGGYVPPSGGGYVPPSGGGYVPPSGGVYVPPSGGGYVPPSGGGYVPPSEGGGGYVPPSGGGGGYVPPSGGGGGYVPPSGGGGGYVPPSGGGYIPPSGGGYVPPSGGGGGYVPPSGGGGGYVPPSGGGGGYVPPKGGGYAPPSEGGGGYVPPSGGGGGYVPPKGGGYVPPSGGGGGYVPPSGGGGGYVPPSGGDYVKPSGGEGGYVQPGGGGYVQPSGGEGYGNQGGNYPANIKEEIFSIMDTIFAIMKHQGLIYDTDNPVWTLIDRGFDLLADFVRRNINRNKHEGECPYSYDVSGGSCLSVDLNALGLSWYEARLYCQVVKGGDLAIFKDANQLRDMQRYLRSFDKKYRYSYYIGASDVKKENDWVFINGEPVPLGTPYWGRTDYDGTQNPSGGEGSDYAILYGKDFFYLADVGYEDSYDIKVVPLCQYFHGRGMHDHAGYHSETGLYHDKGDNLGHKLTNILGLSSAGYDKDYNDYTGYNKPKPHPYNK